MSNGEQVEELIKEYQTDNRVSTEVWKVRALLEVARQLAIANDQYRPPEERL